MTSLAPYWRHAVMASSEKRTIVFFAALDLDEFLDQLPVAAVQVIVNGLALGFKAKSAVALAGS